MNGNLNAALILLDRALEEIETGFVACNRCGDQEDTKDLDFVDDLKSVKAELVALVARKITNKAFAMDNAKETQFKELLERSVNEMEWRRDNQPETWNPADDDHLVECKKALGQNID